MSVQASVVDQTGTVTGTQELDESVFSGIVHEPVMHQALVRQLANARQGTHETRTRTQVRGGGRKPYRQKGTGRARQGSIRAPQFEGGGTVFGPHSRSYHQDMPRRQRRLALRSALTVKTRAEQITILDGFELEAPQTRAVVDLLAALGEARRVLIVLGSHHEMLEKSARNIPEVQVVLASNLSVRDLLMADRVLVTRDAVDHLQEVLG